MKDKPIEVKMIRQNQSFYLDKEIVDLVASFKRGALSKAVKTALLLADKKGALNDFKTEA